MRQILSYGGLCQPRIPLDNNCYLGEAPANLELSVNDFTGYVEQAGTNISLLDMGIMNYIQFGYTVILFFILMAGLIFGLLSKDVNYRSMGVTAVFLFGALIYQTMNARTEDSVRAVLIGVVPMIILGGMYISELVKTMLAKYHSKVKTYAMNAVAILLVLSLKFGVGHFQLLLQNLDFKIGLKTHYSPA